MRIGEQLISCGLISPVQLDEALRAQVIYGGRLGTNLVELGHLDLDQLADQLGTQHGLAAALQHHFEASDRVLQGQFPALLAAQLAAVPLSLVPAPAKMAAVAFLDPPADEILRRVTDVLGCEIVPTIAPELRLRYQLERVYGLPRPNRYIRIGPQPLPGGAAAAPATAAAGPERRRYVTPLSAPDAPGTLGRIALAKRAVRTTSAADEPVAQADLDDAMRAIRTAVDRNQVVEIVVRCLRHGFGAALGAGAFLLVRQEMAIGWRGFSRGADDDVIGAIAIPLSEPSMLRLSYQTRVLVCGKPPPAGELIDQRLWSMLGNGRPDEVVVAPIVVQDRVVCLLYAHAQDLGAIPEALSHRISELAEAAGAAFLRLIRAAER
jgi:hypothetical protein